MVSFFLYVFYFIVSIIHSYAQLYNNQSCIRYDGMVGTGLWTESAPRPEGAPKTTESSAGQRPKVRNQRDEGA